MSFTHKNGEPGRKGEPAKREEVVYLANEKDGESKTASGKNPLVPEPAKSDVDIDNVEDKVIDGSFGWVIVIGNFLSQMIIVGLMRTDGVYYLQFRARFDESAQLSAWPGAVSLTMQSFVGPVATALCNRFSVRTTVIIATCFNVVGLASTGFCTNIYQLFFTYGILQGIGRGMTFVSGIFIVNMYFDRMRARAVGLSMTGAGLGTFALVPFNQFLFETFGFTHAYLLIATIASAGFIMAALFRPLSMHMDIKRAQLRKERARRKQVADIAGGILNDNFSGEEKSTKISLKQSPPREGDSLLHNKNTPGGIIQKEDYNYGASPHIVSKAATADESYEEHEKTSCCKTICSTVFPIEHKTGATTKGGEQKKRKIFHFELFKNVPFLVLCLCMVSYNIGNKTVFSFLPAIGASKGLSDSEASLLISATGVGDTFGRLTAGFIMDQPWVIPEVFYGAVIFLASAATFSVTLAYSFPLFCLAGAMYGCFGGVSISQKPVLLARIMGKDVLTSSFGIMYCFQGFGTLSGPPVSGALKDYFGSYDYAFYLTTLSLFFSGILFVISVLLFKLQKRKAEARAADDTSCGEEALLVEQGRASSYSGCKSDADREGGVQPSVPFSESETEDDDDDDDSDGGLE